MASTTKFFYLKRGAIARETRQRGRKGGIGAREGQESFFKKELTGGDVDKVTNPRSR